MTAVRSLASAYLFAILALTGPAPAVLGFGAGVLAVSFYQTFRHERQGSVVPPVVLALFTSARLDVTSVFSYAAVLYTLLVAVPLLLCLSVEWGMPKGARRHHAVSVAVPALILAAIVTVFFGLVTNDLYQFYFYGSDVAFQVMVYTGIVALLFFVAYDLVQG